jgi:glyoxylase-like metal-dependent hydrolase (beta-lactamase superfamily II)
LDTHLHADHITGLGALRDRTHCIIVMGERTKADVVSKRLGDGDKFTVEGLALDVIYAPGHTDDSYSFVMPDRVFTGDTILIRGTGRTTAGLNVPFLSVSRSRWARSATRPATLSASSARPDGIATSSRQP